MPVPNVHFQMLADFVHSGSTWLIFVCPISNVRWCRRLRQQLGWLIFCLTSPPAALRACLKWGKCETRTWKHSSRAATLCCYRSRCGGSFLFHREERFAGRHKDCSFVDWNVSSIVGHNHFTKLGIISRRHNCEASWLSMDRLVWGCLVSW